MAEQWHTVTVWSEDPTNPAKWHNRVITLCYITKKSIYLIIITCTYIIEQGPNGKFYNFEHL